MNLEDQYKLLVEAYYGICEVDQYDLKEYVLKKIDNLITDFENSYSNTNYDNIRKHVIENVSVKTKLQSSLIVLNEIDESMELILLIKNKLKNM